MKKHSRKYKSQQKKYKSKRSTTKRNRNKTRRKQIGSGKSYDPESELTQLVFFDDNQENLDNLEHINDLTYFRVDSKDSAKSLNEIENLFKKLNDEAENFKQSIRVKYAKIADKLIQDKLSEGNASPWMESFIKKNIKDKQAQKAEREIAEREIAERGIADIEKTIRKNAEYIWVKTHTINYCKKNAKGNKILNIAATLEPNVFETEPTPDVTEKLHKLEKVYEVFDPMNSLNVDAIDTIISTKIKPDKFYIFFWDWDRTFTIEEGLPAVTNKLFLSKHMSYKTTLNNFKINEINNTHYKMENGTFNDLLDTYLKYFISKIQGLYPIGDKFNIDDYVTYLLGGSDRMTALSKLFTLDNVKHCFVSNNELFDPYSLLIHIH